MSRTSSIDLEDLLVRGTEPDGDGFSGAGVVAWDGGTVEIHRALSLANTGVGVTIETHAVATLLEDVAALDTRLGATGTGFGFQVYDDGRAHVERLLVQHAIGRGVSVTNSHLDGQDLIVEDTLARPATGLAGSGLVVENRSTADLTRLRVERAREVAVEALQESEIDLHDSAILDTQVRDCAESSCVEEPAGTGVGSYSGAHVVLDGVRVSGSPLCGVQVAAGGVLDFTSGECSHNVIGANSQDPGYDATRLVRGVYYFDNGTDLDLTNVWFPDPDPGF